MNNKCSDKILIEGTLSKKIQYKSIFNINYIIVIKKILIVIKGKGFEKRLKKFIILYKKT